MAQRIWFPRGAGQEQLGGIPRCDDPPTQAMALEAAIDMVRLRRRVGDAQSKEAGHDQQTR